MFLNRAAAQSVDSGCKQKLINYYKNQGLRIEKNADKTYYIEIEYTSWLKQNMKKGVIKNNTVKSDVKMYTYKNKLYFENESMKVFKNDNEIFSILKEQKVILHSSISENQQNEQAFLVNILKDSLFINSTVIGCREHNGTYGDNMLAIKLLLPERYQKAIKAKYFTVYLNGKKEEITAMEISYLPRHPINRQVIRYKKQGFANLAVLKKPIRNNFFDSKGRLLASYKTYKYVDSAIN